MNYISYFKLKGTFKNDSKYPALSLIAFILKIIALIYLVAGLIGTLLCRLYGPMRQGKWPRYTALPDSISVRRYLHFSFR